MQSSAVPALQAGIVLLAVLFGLVAYTAQPIIVGIAAGVIVAAILFSKPIWNIWLILVLGLLVAGVVPLWAEGAASKAVWGISILGFALMGGAFFRVATTPGVARNTPPFVWVALVFMLYTTLNGLAQASSAYEVLSGVKRHFQVSGLLYALAWLSIGEQHVRRWKMFFLVVALAQLPWALYELIWLVPIREGLVAAYPGLVPIDVVAGTFGASMYTGGANADMATFLVVVLAFFLAHRREKSPGAKRLVFLLPVILAPLFMGETKVVVILLPLVFLTLYRHDLIRRPHYALAGLVLGALLTAGAGYAYLSLSKKSVDDQIADTLRYNIHEKGYGNYLLNRTTVLTFWAERQGAHDPVSVVCGNGLGAAHDMTGGRVAIRYPGYGIGLTSASTLLWEQGLLGTGLFLTILALAWRTAGRLRRDASLPRVRADAAVIQACMPLSAFYLLYGKTLLESMAFQIFFYGLLGYLAWLFRQHVEPADSSP
ncbi:MAG: hypothetical protein HY778_01335 [Betaproteobacteria bacterium]|nr:hypothetical protein [Betaproteobacteria bacterium]